MKNKISFFLIAVLVSSCTYKNKSWNYTPNQYDKSKQKAIQDTAVIQIFEENLDDKGENSVSLLHLIPLYFLPGESYQSSAFRNVLSSHHIKPKGSCIRQSDTAERMIYNPPISLSYALYAELKAKNLFKKLDYICSIEELETKPKYLIKGYINDMHLKTKHYTYGLSIYAFLLHIFGLPTSSIESNLSMTFELIDVSKDTVIFSKRYNATPYSEINNLYVGKNSFQHDEMSKEIFMHFIEDVSTQLVGTK